MDEIRAKIRQLLNDNSTSGSDIFTYGSSAVFTLTESNIISVDEVYRNDVSSGVLHSYNSTTNKVTITSSLTSGDTIQIDYTYYPNYSTTELTNYIQSALVHLSINNYYTFTYDSTDDAIYPDISDKEKNLIALVTATIIEPDNKSIRLPDISISVPSDLPLDRKIGRIISTFKKDTHGIFGILK